MGFFIETERLVLTPFKLEDSKDYFNVISDNDVKKYVPYASAYTLPTTCKHLEVYVKGDFVNDFYIAIRLKDSNKIIGSIIAVRISTSMLDISYLIGKDYRDEGYGTEAFMAFIHYLYNRDFIFNYHLNLTIENDNIPSIRLAKKCGAKLFREIHKACIYRIKIDNTLESL